MAEPLALQLLPYLEAAPNDDRELPSGFLQQLAQQFEDEGLAVVRFPLVPGPRLDLSILSLGREENKLMADLSRPQILDPILSHLREAVAKKTLLDPFLQHLRALALLTKAGPIAKVVR